MSFRDAVIEAAKGDIAFLCYEGDGVVSLPSIMKQEGNDIRFLIGPEGGFAREEIEFATQNGLRLAGLGKRILRTETASSFVLSCLVYEKELNP